MNGTCSERSLGVIAIAALLACTTGCGMLQKPTASITGVKIQNVSVTDATMLFSIKVDNPYALDLPMTGMDYALSSQGQQFLAGKADIQGAIPAGGSKTLGVPVQINFLKLINAVKGARPGATIAYKADLGLSVDAPTWGTLRVPMSKEDELAIPSAQGLLDRLKDMTQ